MVVRKGKGRDTRRFYDYESISSSGIWNSTISIRKKNENMVRNESHKKGYYH